MALGSMQFKAKGTSFNNCIKIQAVSLNELRKPTTTKSEGLSVVTVKRHLELMGPGLEDS